MIFLSFETFALVFLTIVIKDLSAESLRSMIKTKSETHNDHTRKLSDFFMGFIPPTATDSNLHQTTQKPKNPIATISLKPLLPQSQIFPSISSGYQTQQTMPNYQVPSYQTGYKPACQQVCMLCTPVPVRPKPYSNDIDLVRSLPAEIKEKLDRQNYKIMEQLQRLNDDGSQERKFVFNNGLTLYQRIPQAEIEDEVEGFYIQKLEDATYMTTYYKSTETDYYAHSESSEVMPDINELNTELSRISQKQRRVTASTTENLLDI